MKYAVILACIGFAGLAQAAEGISILECQGTFHGGSVTQVSLSRAIIAVNGAPAFEDTMSVVDRTVDPGTADIIAQSVVSLEINRNAYVYRGNGFTLTLDLKTAQYSDYSNDGAYTVQYKGSVSVNSSRENVSCTKYEHD